MISRRKIGKVSYLETKLVVEMKANNEMNPKSSN